MSNIHVAYRRRRKVIAVIGFVLGFLALGSGSAGARASQVDAKNGVVIVQVQGLIDPVNDSLIRMTIADAERKKRTMVVLQIDSPGATDVDVERLIHAVRRSSVPVITWVGPQGAQAKGAAATMFAVSSGASMAPNSTVGPIHPLRLDQKTDDEVIKVIGSRSNRGANDERFLSKELTADQAVKSKLSRRDAIVGEVVVRFDGETLNTDTGPVKLDTADVIGKGRGRRLQPNQPIIFSRLQFGESMLHKFSSPGTAYFFLVAGASLILFEFFAASVGVAGFVGAGCFLASFSGLGHLPVHWWAIGLLAASMFAFAVEIQAGTLGFWTAMGMAGSVVSSIWLFDPPLRPRWWILALVNFSLFIFILGAMTGIVKSRFYTPEIVPGELENV